MITPEQLASSGTEHGHQAAVFCWAALNFHKWPELKLLFHIPNGGERNVIVGTKNKAAGLKKGVVDIFFPVARHNCHGLWIEMKTPERLKEKNGGVSKEQKQWLEDMTKQGYGVCLAYNWETAVDTITKYLSEE